MIEFLCPNGHRIRCPQEQAGRAAKCPKCGVKFRIPESSEAPEPSAGDSDISRPEITDSGVYHSLPEGGPRRASAGEPQIEFLCPNGHRLHGPASLQGRPGECPECGSRFRIPTYEDVSDEEEMEGEISVGRADGSGPTSQQHIDRNEQDAVLGDVEEIVESPEQVPASARPQREGLAGGHPLARLFGKLWSEKPRGAAVELHLGGGETLRPEQFAPALSRSGYGVFAVREGSGTHTLTVVAWDSIVRVLVRGVAELPDEMSD